MTWAQSRRVLGSLRSQAETDPAAPRFTAALAAGLLETGWVDGVNLTIETRWTNGTAELSRLGAAELAALRPDVLLAYSSVGAAEMLKVHGTIPMVFGGVQDAQEQGLVTNLARPGGLVTGFTSLQPAMGGQWVDLIAEVAPATTTVGMIFNPTTAPKGGAYFFDSFHAAARARGFDPLLLPVLSSEEMVGTIREFGGVDGRGIVVMSDTFLISNRIALIEAIAAMRLPAVYGHLLFSEEGAMVSYGIDPYAPMRGAGSYVGRILNGEAPGDLPVQAPTAYHLVVNLVTAERAGVVVPITLLAVADQVIE